jgi:superoxide dismutase, Fe-Mn family
MPFTLPPLPYALDALEPHIDAQTMAIHHGKHHQAYVNNLNAAMEKAPEYANDPVERILNGLHEMPSEVRNAIRNNGGGHWNHSLFWETMGPNGGGEPGGRLGPAIVDKYGSFSAFRDQMKASAVGRFGSGWAWLVCSDGSLVIANTPNQDNPIMDGTKPGEILVGVDVWEHAYYLKYQNRRPDYLDAWFNTINWGVVNARYEKVA